MADAGGGRVLVGCAKAVFVTVGTISVGVGGIVAVIVSIGVNGMVRSGIRVRVGAMVAVSCTRADGGVVIDCSASELRTMSMAVASRAMLLIISTIRRYIDCPFSLVR